MDIWEKAELWVSHYCKNWTHETQAEAGECSKAFSDLHSAIFHLYPEEVLTSNRLQYLEKNRRQEIEEYLMKRRLNGG